MSKSQSLFNNLWNRKPSYADFDQEEKEDRITQYNKKLFGNVLFIGELYIRNMLPHSIIY